MAYLNFGLKTISGRALALILPAAFILFGVLTWTAYEGARQRAISSTIAALDEDRALVQQGLDLRFREIADAERKASKLIATAIASPAQQSDRFSSLFPAKGDGTRRSADGIWTGEAGRLGPKGYGAFISSEDIASLRQAKLLAAFDTLGMMAEGLPRTIDNFYFFSPENDLIMYAPDRTDELAFYRKNAPSDWAFQDEEFSTIILPQNNPAGHMRCTGLQPVMYDDQRKTWTTGCMTPVRIGGQQIGAWGSSIPLDTIFPNNAENAEGDITQIVITGDGQLIRHPTYTVQSSTRTGHFLNLDESDDPALSALWQRLKSGSPTAQSGYLEASDQYYSAAQLNQPRWFVISTIPGEQARKQAFLAARSVLIAGTISTAAFALFLIIFLRRQLGAPLTRLAERADSISAYTANDSDHTAAGTGEIARLDRAFEAMETRIARERLRMAQSFDTMVDAIDDYAILLLDSSGNIRRANRAAKTHFFWDENDSTGLRQIFDPAENAESTLKQLLAKVEEEGRLFQAPRRYRGNGQTFWATEIIQVIQTESGETEGFAYIVRDSSEEHRRVAKMEESLRLLNMAGDTGTLGYWIFDIQTEQLTISRWLGQKFAIPIDKPVDLERILSRLEISGDHNPREAIADAINKHRAFDIVAGFEAPSGEGGFIQIKGEPTFAVNAAGQQDAMGFFGIAREITAEKQAEAKLVAARDQARQAADMRMNLLASVSHEIRTPMSGILGMLDQMRNGGSAREKAKALDLIENSSQALMRILDDVLQQAKLESGTVKIESRPFEPETLVRQTAELFTPLAKRNGAKITVKSSSKRSVLGDPTRIQQILANFTSNAVKFVGNGTVQLTCTEEPAADDRVTLTFTVTDDGIGIDPTKLEKLFEKFEQAEPTTQLEYGGTGLGLSICRDLATAMGGTVGATSKAREGSAFWLKITLAVEASGEEKYPGIGRQALVIEPKATARIAAEIALDALGFSVQSVRSADDKIIAGLEPDLILFQKAEMDLEKLQIRFPQARLISMDGLPAMHSAGVSSASSSADLRALLKASQHDR